MSLDMFVGAGIGIAVTSFVWARTFRKLERKLAETRIAYALLRESTDEQLREYWEFRRKFEEYRAQFDPVDVTREGNVITIDRGKK